MLARDFDDTKNMIEEWNILFPFDYIWRKKYNIPFNSEVHRNMDFFDIKFDIEEEKLFNKIIKTHKEKRYKPKPTGQLLKPRKAKKMTDAEIDEAFDNLDLSAFDNIKV